MMFAQQLIKISFEFVFQNDLQTHHLIEEKSMVKLADNNFTICFWAQTTSTYTVSQTWVVQINVGQTNSEYQLGADSELALVLKYKRGYTCIHIKYFFASARSILTLHNSSKPIFGDFDYW